MPDPAVRQRQRLKDADRLHHLHPFTDHGALTRDGAFMVEGGQGSRLIVEGGIVLLDAMAGLACVNVGYGREELAAAAADAVRELGYYHCFQQATNPHAAHLAEMVAERAPSGCDRVFFSNSGSEANETALKIVRAWWRAHGEPQRTHVIARRYSYHGSTLATASLTGLAHMHEAFGLPVADVSHIMAPYTYREAAQDESEEEFATRAANALAEEIARVGPERVAAFIAEPVQVTGGGIVPPVGYWKAAQRICREHGILFILDEVVTGMGRCGHWFAAEHYELEPDIITLAKGLSSAYQPIGATLVRDEIAQVVLDRAGTAFQHGFTTSAHPVACAVAAENLAIIAREGLIDRAAKMGGMLAAALDPLAGHPLVGEIRRLGLIIG
ncbi:MAG: aminotransferase class III-fold pyridoxal phosphate-dependent enzyme, partial [Alphaproteobacteria bacterium]